MPSRYDLDVKHSTLWRAVRCLGLKYWRTQSGRRYLKERQDLVASRYLILGKFCSIKHSFIFVFGQFKYVLVSIYAGIDDCKSIRSYFKQSPPYTLSFQEMYNTTLYSLKFGLRLINKFNSV